jgi:hypothetical protein
MPSVKPEPIYLSPVENNPQPSHYLNLIQTGQNSGRETWNIWYLFAFRPEMTQPLASFTQAVMREPSPLSPGCRELIAAYTSYVNASSAPRPTLPSPRNCWEVRTWSGLRCAIRRHLL